MSPTTRQRPQRSGFTLTEMLVATGLVVLIMLMFAQIYAVAIGTLREQRGLAQNDQKARIVSNILRNDLQNMTYRQAAAPYGDVEGIVALAPGDEPIIDRINQQGYFYYSENTAGDDTDDLIQFTVRVGSGQRGDAQTKGNQRPFVGKTQTLGVANQPSADNGSSTAEVCYFLRNGTLYRRVLLLRDPLKRRPKADSQPSDPSNGTRVFDSGNPDYHNPSGSPARIFYRDFDFSATRRDGVLWFHSVDSLDNTRGFANVPIAVPAFRFGFVPPVSGISNAGSSREEVGGVFFGRPTVEETSHADFNWPGTSATVANNPYQRTWTLNSDGVIDEFDSNIRVGEDILLTNVEAFNVEALSTSSGATFGSAPDDQGFDTFHPSLTSSPIQNEANFFVNNTMDWAANSSSPEQFIHVPVLASQPDDQESMVYERIATGTTGSIRPEFPPVPGTIVQDGTVGWKCIDNRIGVKAIRITIRFRDTTSNIPRQLTLVHSFVE